MLPHCLGQLVRCALPRGFATDMHHHVIGRLRGQSDVVDLRNCRTIASLARRRRFIWARSFYVRKLKLDPCNIFQNISLNLLVQYTEFARRHFLASTGSRRHHRKDCNCRHRRAKRPRPRDITTDFTFTNQANVASKLGVVRWNAWLSMLSCSSE